MAKEGSEKEQEENSVTYTEIKTVAKSLFKVPQTRDSYHQLTRQEQVIIFRLRTGHNRLNKHLHRLKIVRSPGCQCGKGEQTADHILQDCEDLQNLRHNTWPVETSVQDKLYGPVDMLRRTTQFIVGSGIQV